MIHQITASFETKSVRYITKNANNKSTSILDMLKSALYVQENYSENKIYQENLNLIHN